VEVSQSGVTWNRLEPRFRSRATALVFAKHRLPRRNVMIRAVEVLEPPAIKRDSVSPLLSRR